ncbi:MAG TPA: CDP-diacylglycerol--glycerol-3-phosphate 3-phosphatidyltransferase [Microbacteriaceae bacterium]|jgi:CDP-diacylglycerol---glycerol-3-phosphate 3-phosphatidyltransferase|nr:CDP-diacylglycerol--glycerol-3-phosphate 3-phosphatidyltransferase [Microbacteriaceae bacterium]
MVSKNSRSSSVAESSSTPASGFRGRVISAGDTQVSNANIANIITAIRILVAPVFLWMVFIDGGEDGVWRWVAALLFIAAIATDGIDGALARQRNLVTTSGILLDPIADKVLIGGALVALALVSDLPWWVVVVIMTREIGITLLRFFVLANRVIPASRGGKLKTILQAITVSSWLVPTWVLLGDWVSVLNWVLMGLVIVITLVTGVDYLVKAFRAPESTP